MPAERAKSGRFTAGPMPDHGTRARYQRGCRCDACEFANANYQRARPRRRELIQLSLLDDWADHVR